ncbi:MAG: rod shape-determining protein RodA [Candidatus Omnitrophota bacterium]
MPTTYKVLFIALLIVVVGIMSIYSSTYQKGTGQWQQQIIWLLLGLLCFLFFSNFNYRRFWDITYFLYCLAIFLLLLVFVLGSVRLGAQRWLKVAWFNLQPSELSKLILVIFLARYFSRKSIDDVGLSSRRFGLWQGLILPLIFISVPVALIIEQPDLGSGVMILLIFICMLYVTQLRLRYILIFLALAVSVTPIFWHFLRDYQKDRLMVFLNPNIDPLGAGYTLIQSKIAIGSGAILGKGWLSGTQSQLHFLPESHTDFIFSTFAEEWGFAGGAVLILLYYFIIREGFLIAARTTDHFGRLLGLGISLMLGLQVFVNISMTLGLMPIVGLPLPLMSYGGSSIVVTFISLGILVNIDRRRAVF